MAWEWSHSNDAYENAYANLSNQDREFLEVVFAEWEATPKNDDGMYLSSDLDLEIHDEKLKAAKELPTDVLVDYIWDKASEHATCDNGGFNAHMCPHGCHTVSFDQHQLN